MTDQTMARATTGAPVDSLRDHQIELERLFSKNQLIPRIKAEFTNCPDFNFRAYFQAHNIPEEFGFDLLVQMVLHKRADLQTLVGCLKHHFPGSNTPCQDATNAIIKAAEADLVDYQHASRMFIVKINISDDVQEELDRFQFPLPMVVPPKQLKSNRDTGYLTTGGSVILRKNHHEDDVCLDHINRVNKTRFTINTDTARMVKNKWRNLDRPKEGETQEEFLKRKKAFEKYDRTAKDVIALLTQESDSFHLTHKYDKRGRIYCMGWHVNYQGNSWCKAIVEFADKEGID